MQGRKPELQYWQIYKAAHEDPLFIESNLEKIQALSPGIWEWILKDISIRGNIFYHVAKSASSEILNQIPKTQLFQFMAYLITCGDVDCFNKILLQFFGSLHEHFDELLDIVINKKQIALITCFVNNNITLPDDINKINYIAEFIAQMGDYNTLANFFKKTIYLSSDEKQNLIQNHIHPFWSETDNTVKSQSLAAEFSQLGMLYQEADQSYHQTSIVNLAKRLCYRFKKNELTIDFKELAILGEWRQRLSLCNRGSRTIYHAPKFGIIRSELSSCTAAEGVYADIEKDMAAIDFNKNSDYIRRIQGGTDNYQAIIFYKIKEKEVLNKLATLLNKNIEDLSDEDKTIQLTGIHKNDDTKSLLVHTNPSQFQKIFLMLNYEINNALKFQFDIKDEVSIQQLTEKIGGVQWWWSHAMFFKRGSETVGEGLIRGIFYALNLNIEGFTTYPYLSVFTTPNISDYKKRYPFLLKSPPSAILDFAMRNDAETQNWLSISKELSNKLSVKA